MNRLFDIDDCTMITIHEYRCLSFNFPQWVEKKFGMVMNERGMKFYLIKDKFKKQLEEQGFL